MSSSGDPIREDRVGRLAHPHDTAARRLRAHEVIRGELGVAVAENLVDRAGYLSSLHVRAPDVIRRAGQCTGHRLDPVAMNDDQVRLVFGEKLWKADDGRGKNRILTVPWPLVRELEHFGALHPVHLDLREAVHLQHVHAGNEEADPVARVPRGLGERADLAEIRPRPRYEQDFPRHPGFKSLHFLP